MQVMDKVRKFGYLEEFDKKLYTLLFKQCWLAQKLRAHK